MCIAARRGAAVFASAGVRLCLAANWSATQDHEAMGAPLLGQSGGRKDWLFRVRVPGGHTNR